MARQEVSIPTTPAGEAIDALGDLPEVSICIVNWNCCDYLRSLLASLEAARDDLILETIVVDNASTDGSALMVQAEFPEIHLIRNEHHAGIATANNQAAARACGRLLFFLNNDTSILPGGLTLLVRAFDDRPELSAVAPKLITATGKPQISVRQALSYRALLHRVCILRWTGLFCGADRKYRQLDFDHTRSAYVEHIVGPALLVRRQPFTSIGGWDEAFQFRMDDIDLSFRLARFGKMYYLADAQVIHWGGIATDLDRTYAYYAGECSIIHFVRKHFGLRAALLYKLLITADMPLRILVLSLSWIPKRLFSTRARAARNFRKLAAACHFVRELPAYWAS